MNLLPDDRHRSSDLTDHKIIIFTDLDGTLLDHFTYSYSAVLPLVVKLRKREIPIIFCSSKTRAEQEVYQIKMGISEPFIVENGGAIFINRGYFTFPYEYHRVVRDYHVIELDMPYREIRNKLKQISEKNGLTIRGFGDMDAAEIAELTGLDLKSARLAKKREYGETLNIKGSEQESQYVLSKIEMAGLKCLRGGRFYSVTGKSDKGKATRIVTELFKRKLGKIKTIGIGDSLNDVPMLSEVDVPVLVQKPGDYWEKIDIKNLYRIEGVGPQGWARAIEQLTGVRP